MRAAIAGPSHFPPGLPSCFLVCVHGHHLLLSHLHFPQHQIQPQRRPQAHSPQSLLLLRTHEETMGELCGSESRNS
ncbi:hypothetical protein INR49_025770 [Caranx melampygus]|nr:hypothetical protein INR49_025770 [Caranx melampygus]